MGTILYFLVGLLVAMVLHRKGTLPDDDISIAIGVWLLWAIAIPVMIVSYLIEYNSEA